MHVNEQGTLDPATAAAMAARAAVITGSFIDKIMSILPQRGGGARADVISFGDGSPGAEALPAADFSLAAQTVFSEPSCPALNYGPTEGDGELREQLLALLARLDGEIRPERLVITAGGMQGLDLVCKLFVDPGDPVIVELPAFTNTLATVASYQGDAVPVRVDGDGMVTDELAETCRLLRRRPKLIYVNPHFQNPTGATMPIERRRRLLEIAAEHGAVVLEDDPYAWLGYDGQRLPSLYRLSGEADWVIGVHTFSKVIGPGARVGWCIAAPEIVRKMVNAKQGMDTCTNMLGQRLIAVYLREGKLERRLPELRALYRRKRDAICAALGEFFGDLEGATWTHPEGGFFVWLTLPAGIDTEAMFPRAVEHGVAFVPGRAFTTTNDLRNQLRLSFSRADPEHIREGLRRLRSAYDEEIAAGRGGARLPRGGGDDRDTKEETG